MWRRFWGKFAASLSAGDEVPEHRAQSGADVAARRGTAGAGARRRALLASGDRAALTRGTRTVSPLAVHGSLFSRGAAFRYSRCAGRGVVANRRRSHQFSCEAGVALARFAHPRAVSWSHFGVQGFWRAIYGAADGLLRSGRNAAADGSGGHLRRHGKRRRPWVPRRARNSRGDSLSFEAYQRSAGEAVHDAGRKYHGARSGGQL